MSTAAAFKSREPISRDIHPAVYAIMDSLIAAHHPELAEAEVKIALVWWHDKKPPRPDQDGKIVAGRCRKAPAVHHALHARDFVIELRWHIWQLASEPLRRAILDHELTHASVYEDDEGKPGKRIRKHDLEEFVEVVRRHGLYREEIKDMLLAAAEHAPPGDLFAALEAAPQARAKKEGAAA